MKSVHVWPVEGMYLSGVPHVEHDCEDPLCVKSGAFTEKPPPKSGAKSEEEPDETPKSS